MEEENKTAEAEGAKKLTKNQKKRLKVKQKKQEAAAFLAAAEADNVEKKLLTWAKTLEWAKSHHDWDPEEKRWVLRDDWVPENVPVSMSTVPETKHNMPTKMDKATEWAMTGNWQEDWDV
jgi:hypothetical protein